MLFKAASVAPDAPENGTAWVFESGPVADAIAAVVRLTADSRRVEAKLDAAKQILEKHAGRRWLQHFARYGRQPPPPIQLVTRSGQSVLFVVQDRTSGRAPSAYTISALEEELGASALDEGLAESTLYSLNPDILAIEARDPLTKRKSTVLAMVNRRLSDLVGELAASGQLDRNQGRALVTVVPSRVFRPDFLSTLGTLCRGDPSRLGRAIAALGTSIVRFTKSH